MNLLYWTPFYHPDVGGIETISRYALPRLARLGYRIMVVTSFGRVAGDPVIQVDGITVHRFPFQQSFHAGDHINILHARRRIKALKEDFQPNIVHLNLSDPSVLLHLMTNTHAVPTLMALHTNYLDDRGALRNGGLFKKALHSAQWVTSVCQAGLQECINVVPEIEGRASVEFNGVDLDRFKPRRSWRDTPMLLCPGRLVPAKGIDRAIQAMKRVVRAYPSATLVIAGDGPERAYLERCVADNDLHDSIQFLGTVEYDHVAQLMEQCNAVLLPSRNEGLPMVVLEAAAMARPVVAFPAGDTTAIVEHRKTGLVVPQDDIQGFAAAIMELLDSPDLAREMGCAARHKVEQHFGIDAYVDRYDKLYRRLVSENTCG